MTKLARIKCGRRASRLLVTVVLAGAALAATGCLQTVVLDHNGGGGNNGGGGYGGGGGWNPPGGCPANSVSRPTTITQGPPDVLIALDRSPPANAHFGGDGMSWIATEQQQLLQQVAADEKAINFGYQEFPVNTPGCFGAPGCCPGAVAPPLPGNLDTIQLAMNACSMTPGGCVSGATPTASALMQSLNSYTESGDHVTDRYVLLITDGDPSCSSDGVTPPCTEAVNAIVSLRHAGIQTIVVGVGDGVDSSTCLDMMATNGGAGRMNGPPYYYAARDPSQLASDLGDILGNLAGAACHIELAAPVMDPSSIALYLGGPIPYDPTDQNGWSFNPGSQFKITVYGQWCTMLQNADSSQLVVIGCPTATGQK